MAEIIPKEPGQVMLPRDKKSLLAAFLEFVCTPERTLILQKFLQDFFILLINLRIIAPFIRKFYYE